MVEEETIESAVPRQPVDSTVKVERRKDGITFWIPAVGVWKGSKGLMFCSVLWNGFIFFLVGSMILGSGEVEPNGGDESVPLPGNLLAFLLMIFFAGIGIAMFLLALHMGRRKAVIATANDRLYIVSQSIFGKKTRQWSWDRISRIRCGRAGWGK